MKKGDRFQVLGVSEGSGSVPPTPNTEHPTPVCKRCGNKMQNTDHLPDYLQEMIRYCNTCATEQEASKPELDKARESLKEASTRTTIHPSEITIDRRNLKSKIFYL